MVAVKGSYGCSSPNNATGTKGGSVLVNSLFAVAARIACRSSAAIFKRSVAFSCPHAPPDSPEDAGPVERALSGFLVPSKAVAKSRSPRQAAPAECNEYTGVKISPQYCSRGKSPESLSHPSTIFRTSSVQFVRTENRKFESRVSQ